MAKTAKHDVFDMTGDIERIKRKHDQTENGVQEMGEDCKRRKGTKKDKALNVRIPEELHERLRDASYNKRVSMNLICLRAIQEYMDREGL